MTLHTFTQSIKETFSDIFGQISGSQDFRYYRELIAALVIFGVVFGGYSGYNYYKMSQENAAQYLFEQNVEEFERVTQEGGQEDWASVETLFKLAYDQYPNSAFAPLCLLYQAQAARRQNKDQAEVDQLVDKAISSLPKDSPLHDYLSVQKELVKLDLPQSQEKALLALRDIAFDEKNAANDIAAYQLGLYYWTHNQDAQAKEVWQKLIDSQKNLPTQGVSPWAQLAEQKLATVA